MQTNNYTFPVLLDDKMAVTRAYGVQSTPTNFLIDRDGVIRYKQAGAFPSQQDFDTKINTLLK
jgi:peroxiredoxin